MKSVTYFVTTSVTYPLDFTCRPSTLNVGSFESPCPFMQAHRSNPGRGESSLPMCHCPTYAVRYPASCSRRGNVSSLCEAAERSVLSVIPCADACSPVRNEAREGEQSG